MRPKYSYVELQSGSILRVSHIETWAGFIDPSGEETYAEIENGPMRGKSVILGFLTSNNSGIEVVGIWNRTIQPYEPRDDGIFWAW